MNENHLNLAVLSHLFVDEDKARAFLESKLWPAGPVCPHCACTDIYKLTAKPTSTKPVRPGVYKCKACRKQFTVRVGTIFEDSHVPLCKWLMALHLMTSSKKGVSSLQLSRELGITMKSAWFLSHRIREAMRTDGPQEPLGDENTPVEVDETYVGGKPRKGDGKVHKRGAGTSKQPVMVLVERNGAARSYPIEKVDKKTMHKEVAVQVATNAILMTDEGPHYGGIRDDGSHRTVTHYKGEYGRRDPDGTWVSTNEAESFFALLKRGHYGIFHQLSKHHLHRYCNEFAFRWTHRKVSDGERMCAAIRGADGKRLTYHQSKASA